MQRKLIVTPDQFQSFKRAAVGFRFPGTMVQLTSVIEEERKTKLHDAFRVLWSQTTGRFFVVHGERLTQESKPTLSASIVPLPEQYFDHAFLVLLARAFENKDILVLPYREVWVSPDADFDAVQTRLVAVSNAFSLASWVQDPIVSGCAAFAENVRRVLQRPGVNVGALPDSVYSDQKVDAVLTYIKTYPPITQVLAHIADK